MGESQSGTSTGGHQLVVVALPADDDPVRRFSSEKVPHLTLLYLGDAQYSDSEMQHVTEYVEHAASFLCRFDLNVESRGVLGDQDADVLFFNKRWSQGIAGFRRQLLADPLISRAYLETDQFPDWAPHLTMGYPTSPAKKDTRDHPGISYVSFDRVAIWTGDYEGPTFQLKTYDYGLEVAMSQFERGRSATSAVLQHYGVKGMRWGVHKAEPSGGSSSPSPRASEDFKDAAKANSKAETGGGLHVLSNMELQKAITRMNLENQYHNLTTQAHQTELDRGLQTTQKILKIGKTAEDVRKFLATPTGKAVKTGVSAAFTAAAAYATGGGSAAAKVGTSIVIRKAANHFTNVGN